MNQSVLEKAVMIATDSAMNGNPIKSIDWMPPQTGASDPDGSFIVTYCEPTTGSLPTPWLPRG